MSPCGLNIDILIENTKILKHSFLLDFPAIRYDFLPSLCEMSTPGIESTRTSHETRSLQIDACLPQDMASSLIFASRPITRNTVWHILKMGNSTVLAIFKE